MQTSTIEIPLELKKEIENMANIKGKDFNKYILDVIIEHMEQIADENIKDTITSIRQSGLMSKEDRDKLLNELKS